MSGLILRLAAPMQAWGERSAFTEIRDSAPFPTRSGLIGLLASAEGRPRHQVDLTRYQDLRITVRVDRPGERLEDYHTVGGGQPKSRTAATAGGSNKGAAVITRRHYLADAVFTVAITTPTHQLAEELTDALRRPYWAPYLGRRSCPPDQPFLLAGPIDDPDSELRTRVPLSRPAPIQQPAWDTNDPGTEAEPSATVPVEFLIETDTATVTPGATLLETNDNPLDFSPHSRSYGARLLQRRTEQLPATLLGPQRTLMKRLIDYADGSHRA
ncbi:type I-E CRISPR-associated protein Cas5/CasD [Streptacidiphilus neutrinimicus]|uniref:type I-E CRISPR-associated protein Cas5/CasD n=1 Tax=Streptacidiphilus neutrinimicus TaxID=105420 RepID=UPI0005A827DD|nr:type I-E CRISPR-associated protein Cas5/CasD [Streptacidiphilus neutrinimicus]